MNAEKEWMLTAVFFFVLVIGLLAFSWIKNRREQREPRQLPDHSDNGTGNNAEVKSDSDKEPFG